MSEATTTNRSGAAKAVRTGQGDTRTPLAITGFAELKFVGDRRLPKMVLAEKQKFLAYILDHKEMVGVKPHRKEPA
jgi:hypothetical protein